jgi:hypothetical protein
VWKTSSSKFINFSSIYVKNSLNTRGTTQQGVLPGRARKDFAWRARYFPKEAGMDTEDMTFTALHVLYGRLQTLRSLELLEVIDANFSTYYQDILEEASAAHSQVITLLDTLYQELAYYRQYFQESQEQHTRERSR